MFVRDRIEAVRDPETPFLEFSALAANGMYDDEAPSAGIVTGIGMIHGHRTVIVANDATVKGGTYFPITVKKRSEEHTSELQSRPHLVCRLLLGKTNSMASRNSRSIRAMRSRRRDTRETASIR